VSEREREAREARPAAAAVRGLALSSLCSIFLFFVEEIAAASPYLEAIHAELVAHVLWSGQATLLALCGR
jgi:hypothetical protein